MTFERVDLGADVTLYRGDNRAVLPILSEIGAIVTDPPYGIAHPCDFANRGRGNLARCNNYSNVVNDDAPFDPSLILSLSVPVVLWGGNYYADRLPVSGGWLVWDKERPDELDQATCELAWTNCIKGVRRFKHLWHGTMRASEHGENYHPTQKPVALFRWVLSLRWLSKTQIIVDPYMGAGACGVAAVQLGRKFIGIEIDETYFEIAKRRISEALAQPRLFSAEVVTVPPEQLRLAEVK